jgi:hypothetical protein
MTYQFYIELLDSEPLVWRRIVVPADYNFLQLHMAIQGAFGWKNCHLFQFSESGFADNTVYGVPGDDFGSGRETIDAKKAKIKEVLEEEGQIYCYIYDFGDEWTHKLVLEKIEANEMKVPACLEGAGACPPEDVGGIHGYQEVLNIIKKPTHPEKAGYIEWLGLAPGEKWDAELCNITDVNKRLALLKK